MSPIARKARTASEATAVQIARRVGGRDRLVKHLGSAHTEVEPAVLLEAARAELHPGQGVFRFDSDSPAGGPVVVGQSARVLLVTLGAEYRACGFERL